MSDKINVEKASIQISIGLAVTVIASVATAAATASIYWWNLTNRIEKLESRATSLEDGISKIRAALIADPKEYKSPTKDINDGIGFSCPPGMVMNYIILGTQFKGDFHCVTLRPDIKSLQ
ncbi:hypothetical protein [Methylobacterium oryzae]|uniref:hypothetical protein n=1 Tax=Methylobacterium oryzae TaxID=334852 RepID=UPI002F35D0F9